MAVAEREIIVKDMEAQPFRVTREQYYSLADMGWFLDKRVERIEGVIVEMPPMSRPHRTTVILVTQALQKAFSKGYFIAAQVSLEIGEFHDPEPDIAVFSGDIRDYSDAPLDSALLVVEVSITTLGYDRNHKAAIYALAGIEEYWIINVEQQQVEVYRAPKPQSRGGSRYSDINSYGIGDFVTPLAAQEVLIAVTDLLP